MDASTPTISSSSPWAQRRPRTSPPASGTLETRYQARLDLQRSAAGLLSELTQLVSRGLQHIVITGIPDVGLIPRYDVDGNGILDGSPGPGGGWKGHFEEYHHALRASEYSAYLDELIRTEVIPELEALGVTVEEMEADWLAHADLVFFDKVHPNAQVHALVRSYIQARMEGIDWIETMPMLIGAASEVFTGTIGAAGETDGFEVMIKKGQTYVIDVLGMSTLGAAGSLADPKMVVTTLRGHILQQGYETGSGSDKGLGFDGHFVFTSPYTGRYILLVVGEESLTRDYEIRFAMAASPALTLAAAFGKEALAWDVPPDVAMAVAGAPDLEPVLEMNEFMV